MTTRMYKLLPLPHSPPLIHQLLRRQWWYWWYFALASTLEERRCKYIQKSSYTGMSSLLAPCQPYRARIRTLTRPRRPLRTPCPLHHWRSTPTPVIHSLPTPSCPSLLALLLLPHKLGILLRVSDVEQTASSICHHSRLLLHRAWYLKTHVRIGGDGSGVGVARCCLHGLLPGFVGHFIELVSGHAGDLFRAGLGMARFELRRYLVDGWGHTAREGLRLRHSR